MEQACVVIEELGDQGDNAMVHKFVSTSKDGHVVCNATVVKFASILREGQDAMIVKKQVYINLKKDF